VSKTTKVELGCSREISKLGLELARLIVGHSRFKYASASASVGCLPQGTWLRGWVLWGFFVGSVGSVGCWR